MSNFEKFLIISLSRSGGKLLRTLLDGHPRLKVFPFEHWNTRPKCHFGPRAHARFATFSPEKKLDVCGFLTHTRTQLEKRHAAEEVDSIMGRMLDGAQRCARFSEIYDLFADELFEMLGEDLSKPIVVNHCGSLCLLPRDQIEMIYGYNRRIMSVRDPRGVFASMDALRSQKFSLRREALSESAISERGCKNFLDGRDESYLHEFCLKYKTMILNHLFDDEQVVSVRFEDVVTDTETAMRRVAKDLGISFDECLLTPTENGAAKSANTSFNRAPDRVDPAAASDWQNHLPEQAQKYIRESLAPEMELLGYV